MKKRRYISLLYVGGTTVFDRHYFCFFLHNIIYIYIYIYAPFFHFILHSCIIWVNDVRSWFFIYLFIYSLLYLLCRVVYINQIDKNNQEIVIYFCIQEDTSFCRIRSLIVLQAWRVKERVYGNFIVKGYHFF